ncbi:DUF2057 family protein [Marinobacter mobilis]|uniref:Uncharacterized conserved protein YccT, UPF0319 family n=1 Tax=Marinobacter mobilis TaxID=488533 RepID=A0A1H3B345_9GAMM|nr:DUF2057 family protein [Marinobacter mobilis]SDX36376.1 Uncharacterized conserved protein YccT, UPF0319 family [Marinobacter mobilis]
MHQRNSFGFLPNGVRGLVMVFLAVVVATAAGCSSSFKRIQTWDGSAVDESQLAILKAPGQIEVIEVNGNEVGNYLMDDLALDYELLPGQNVVVFQYKTIWGKATVVERGESKVNVVESGRQQFVVDARAGEEYRFSLPEPQNQREAEAMMANFRAQLVDRSGRVVASSEAYREPVAAPTPAVTTAGVVATSPAVPVAPAGDLNALDGLKVLWERANADEKREFLRWAFQ